MDLLTALSLLNYAFVLLYGLLLSVHIAGGWETPRQKRLVIWMVPLLLLVLSLCFLLWGTELTRRLYPVVIHLPLVLVLIFGLKKSTGVSLVSVSTAYLCCQLPRWINLLTAELTGLPFVGEICYTLSLFGLYPFLHRYFVRTAQDAMSYSRQNLLLFGSLPCVYYLFDYATVIYSNALYAGIPALTEFFPTASIGFYVLFLTAYHAQTKRRTAAELQGAMLEMELKQSAAELESMRRVSSQTAVYRHDMRHHLAMIDSFLSAGKAEQAAAYIQKVQSDVDAITPRRFCQHEVVNLLCSAFSVRAERSGCRLTVEVQLPAELPVSDTELCSLLSNALENALHAVAELPETERSVSLYCALRHGKLLIQVRNPYRGKISMRDGLPVSPHPGHGYGCRSIQTIAEQHRGLCAFEAENGIFTLRVVLPAEQSPFIPV